MLIRITHDLLNSELLRQTKNKSGEWQDIKFTEETVDECDILLCLSYPSTDLKVNCTETWLLSQEPPARIRRWERDSYGYFDRVFSTWADNPTPSQPCTHWFPNLSYDELTKLKPPIKSKNLSWITSTNSDLHGHKLRMNLVKSLQNNNFDFNLFGRGFNFLEDKAEGLLDYRYSIAVENFSVKNYWTEKIADCFLCWTIPLYWGATNIDKYFPSGSYLQIDPAKPDEVKQIINDAVNSNYYENNLDKIEEARELVLNKYQLFPHIYNLVKQYYKTGSKKIHVIPKNIHPKKDRGIRKLVYKFNYRLSKHFNL